MIRTTAGRISLLLIALFVPLVFSIFLEDGFELPQTVCALVATAFLLLMPRARDWAWVFQSNRPLYFLAAAFLACGVFSFTGLAQNVSFYFPTENYLWVLGAALFLAPVGLSPEKRKFYSFLVLPGLLGSFYAFAQAMGMDFGGWETRFGGRSFSTLGNPVFWAGHLLVLFPLAVYLALSSKGKGEGFFWFGTLGLLTASLLTTQTRGAWLGFLGEAVVLAVLSRGLGRVWKGLMMGIIVFLLTLLLVPSLKDRAISIAQIHNPDAQGRYFLWKVAWRQWEEKKWFGQGPGGYANHFQRVQAELSRSGIPHPDGAAFHAHEEFLELLAERGLVGFVLGTMLLGVLIKRRVKNTDPSVFSMDSAELAVMAGIGIHSLFNFPLSVVPTACALCLLFNPSWNQPPPPSPKPGGLFSLPRTALGILLAALCGFAMRVVAQNARLHQAIDQTNGQQYGEALKTLDFNPADGFFHYLDPRVLRQRAMVLDSLGRGEEAVRWLNQTVRAYPYDADAYATLCMLYGKQKRWKAAQEAGEKALDISPGHEPALNNLAMAAFLRGKKKETVLYLARLEGAEAARGEDQKASQTREKIKTLQKTRRRH